MRTRIHVGLIRFCDPRLIRIVLAGLMLAVLLLGRSGVVYADPCDGSSGCSGG
jgi:hypothetical protein